MKFLNLLLLSLLAISLPVFSQEETIEQELTEGVFIGEEEWNFGTNYHIEVLHLEGVQMDAIEEAMMACLQSNEKCVLKNVALRSIAKRYHEGRGEERRFVKYRAVVQSIDELGLDSLTRGELYTANTVNRRGMRFDALEHLGAKKRALDAALSACYADGNDLCTYVQIRNDGSNYETEEYKYNVKAVASVRGYRLNSIRNNVIY